jgi:hypothetical protein
MRVLLDECVPRQLKRELTDFTVSTVQDMGWAGLTNGELLSVAAGQFDAVLTVDRGLAFQHDTSRLELGIVIVEAASNDVDDIRPLLPAARAALKVIAPGQCVRVGPAEP